MDTLGSLVDKLFTVDQKMFCNQETLYEIRRMDFEAFRARYLSDEEAGRALWETLKKVCDLNVQRHQLVEAIDRALVDAVRAVLAGDVERLVQPQHKTY